MLQAVGIFIRPEMITILDVREYVMQDGETTDGRLEVSYAVNVEESNRDVVEQAMETEVAITSFMTKLNSEFAKADFGVAVTFVVLEVENQVVEIPPPPDDNDNTLLIVGITASILLVGLLCCGWAAGKWISRKQAA